MKSLKFSMLLFGFCLFLSCSSGPTVSIDETVKTEEISISFLGKNTLFGIVVKQFKVEIDLVNGVDGDDGESGVDYVEVIVIEEEKEFMYGSVRLEKCKGAIENLKIPEFVEVLYFYFMDKDREEVRDRVEIAIY